MALTKLYRTACPRRREVPYCSVAHFLQSDRLVAAPAGDYSIVESHIRLPVPQLTYLKLRRSFSCYVQTLAFSVRAEEHLVHQFGVRGLREGRVDQHPGH